MPYTIRMNELTPIQRHTLKAAAHHLEPVVIIGDAGLTPAVMNEIDVHLKSHELIKIRIHGDERATRLNIQDEISAALHASLVQHVGKILVMYRPKATEKGEKKSPQHKPRARNTTRRTKRSYQG